MRKRSVLISVLAVAAIACNKPQPAQSSEAKPLPADVQKVAAAVNTAPAPTTATESQPSAAAATETGGTIIATGEFVSPVR